MSWRGWRLVLGAGSLAVIAGLGVWAGSPMDALLVVLAGPPIVAWLAVADQPRRALIGYAGLMVVLLVLFVRSQLTRGVLHPPPIEWALGFAVFGGTCVGVAVAIERRLARRARGPWLAARRTDWRRVGIGIATLTLACATWPRGGPGFPPDTGWFEVNDSIEDMAALPAGVAMIAHDCESVGGGICNPYFVLSATDGASRAQLAERLIDHFIHRGWTLPKEHIMVTGLTGGSLSDVQIASVPVTVVTGCRPVRGIITWRPHCIKIFRGAEEPWPHQTSVGPYSVIVYEGTWVG